MIQPSPLLLMRFQANDPIAQTQERLRQLFTAAGFEQVLEAQDYTAVKVHFGEERSITHLDAQLVKPLVDMIKKAGARPFITDTTVLYKSVRDNAIGHLELAFQHGYTFDRIGAPVIIADGIVGRNETELEINAPLNRKVALATEFVTANSIIVVSHATGHLNAGLGATLKNLGMGMASRRGKLVQHSVSKPTISAKKCTACGVCARWCPVNCISVGAEYAVINDSRCIGCGECLTVCRFGAVRNRWDSSSALLQKQIAEHALGIVSHKRGRLGYFTFLINMTKDCDCLTGVQQPILPDIGVIAGRDPVAIDQAIIDLTSHNGQNLAQLAYPNIDYRVQLEYAEKIGVGTRQYQLNEVTF